MSQLSSEQLAAEVPGFDYRDVFLQPEHRLPTHPRHGVARSDELAGVGR